MARNTTELETLLFKSVDRLQIALPAGWDAAVSGTGTDRLLTVRTSTGHSARYAVEAQLSPTSNASVINQLRARTGSDLPLVFVTEYINPPLRAACRDSGFGYLDSTGWAYLVHDEPPMLIRLDGASRPPRPRGSEATSRLTGPAAGRAIRKLLDIAPPIGIRELAELAESSPAAVSKLMPALTSAGAVDRDGAGAVVRIRRRTLLDRWTADYGFMRSHGVVLDYLAPRGLADLVNRLSGRDDLCVTGSPGARHYLPLSATSVIPLRLVPLYASDPEELAAGLKLIRADRATSNVLVAVPRDETLLRHRERTSAGVPVAPLGQVLADLQTLPGRFAQEADQLIDHLSIDDPSWSE